MAVITDNTDTLTIENVDEDIKPDNERTTKRSGGGNNKTIIGGERFMLDIEMRLTPAQFRTLITIYNSNADNKFYTPNDTTKSFWTDLYPDIDFPLNSTFSDLTKNWDNRSHWYVKMTVESMGYI